MSRFIWARNRNAAGRGSDPTPQIIHDDVGVSHLEIVASHPVHDSSLYSIDMLIVIYPPPQVERL